MSGAMRTALFGGLVAAIATLPGLGTVDLWDNSETAYGEVARRDSIDPRLGRHAFELDPVVRAAAALLLDRSCIREVFGVGAFALRLPSALATVAMGAAIGYATTTLAGSRIGSTEPSFSRAA